MYVYTYMGEIYVIYTVECIILSVQIYSRADGIVRGRFRKHSNEQGEIGTSRALLLVAHRGGRRDANSLGSAISSDR